MKQKLMEAGIISGAVLAIFLAYAFGQTQTVNITSATSCDITITRFVVVPAAGRESNITLNGQVYQSGVAQGHVEFSNCK